MQTAIEQIGETLKRATGVSDVQFNRNQLVVTVLLGDRKQTVLLECHSSKFGEYGILQFQSRVCIPQNAQQIRQALELNGNYEFWSLALDTSVDPAAIDICYSMIVQNSDIYEILTALTRIAASADELEHAAGGSDHF